MDLQPLRDEFATAYLSSRNLANNTCATYLRIVDTCLANLAAQDVTEVEALGLREFSGYFRPPRLTGAHWADIVDEIESADAPTRPRRDMIDHDELRQRAKEMSTALVRVQAALDDGDSFSIDRHDDALSSPVQASPARMTVISGSRIVPVWLRKRTQ